MRTLAALVFIAVAAVVAIGLAWTPTVAAGSVMEAELMALVKAQGVVGVVCDARIPVGRDGAAFRCTATLEGGRMQALDCELDRDGRLTAKPASGGTPGMPPAERTRRAIPATGDPWGDRP